MSDLLLAADVGGTKTNLGVFSAERGPRDPLATAKLSSDEFPGLEDLCRSFLDDVGLGVSRASIGVPGPVVEGRVTTTNLPWQIDERVFAAHLGLKRVALFNDLMAIAYAIPILEGGDIEMISEGHTDPKGAIGVIAVGTGLGEAFLSWHEGGYVAHPSEGGHTDFGPRTELQVGLLSFLRQRYEHVSYERVCSGRSLPNLYDYLKEIGFADEPEWLAAKLAGLEDRTPTILSAATEGGEPCALCEKTLELFVSILGAKAGNLALTTLATGGVYIGGGIPPRILPALRDRIFDEAFQGKGRLRRLLEKVPVHVIRHPGIALVGAACHGLKEESTWENV